jgi:N-acetylmuramic acid 6-phosphate etherase
MMVDLQRTSDKLVERSVRTIVMVTGLDVEPARELLDAADGHVKTALVMNLAGVDAGEAKRRLSEADGFVRRAIQNEPAEDPQHP